jgi:hypothetical protein
MRPVQIASFAAVLVMVTASVAAAQKKKGGKEEGRGDDVVGTYDVRYEEVSSSCEETAIVMNRGTLEIVKRKAQLTVDIPRFPLMTGTPQRGGKVRAASKLAPSSIDGVDGKFSVAGRVDEGLISLVFIAEYYVGKKPLCSQTWNVSGQKSAKATKDKGAQAAPDETPRAAAYKAKVKQARAARRRSRS